MASNLEFSANLETTTDAPPSSKYNPEIQQSGSHRTFYWPAVCSENIVGKSCHVYRRVSRCLNQLCRWHFRSTADVCSEPFREVPLYHLWRRWLVWEDVVLREHRERQELTSVTTADKGLLEYAVSLRIGRGKHTG